MNDDCKIERYPWVHCLHHDMPEPKDDDCPDIRNLYRKRRKNNYSLKRTPQ
jgi:hypothetical protein